MGEEIFISYSRKDEDFVHKLEGRLKSFGVRIWRDKRSIPAGEFWDRFIEQAINQCNRFLLVLSSSCIESDNVKKEIDAAISSDRSIVPIRIDDCEIPDQIKKRKHNCIDFSPEDLENDSDPFRLLLEGLGRLHPPESNLFRSPAQIRSPPRNFTGREKELGVLLARFEDGAAVIALRGMGGIGKTAVACKIAEQLRDFYPDGQLLVELDGTGEAPMNPSDAMARIIHSYDAGASLPDDDKERENFYRSFLNKKRALILLDNALDDRQVQPLLPPPESSVIVTSRQELSLPTITVCLFEPDKSIELLKAILAEKRAIKQEYESSLVEIARLCGNLPLALRLAGAFLAKSRDMSPEDYAGSLRDERSRLERIDKGSAENGVQASLNLSYSQLHAKAAAAFRMLSVFPADFDSGAEEVICQDEGHEQLRELLQWSLAEYQEETKRYRLHDLVRIYAKDQLEKNGEADIGEAHQLHSAYYLPVLKRSNELLLSGGTSLVSGLKLFDLEWQNISAGQSWARIHSSASQECSEICSNYALQGSILDLRLHQRENIQWREAALDCARRTGNKKAEGAHLSNLGSAYFLLSDARKAIEYHEQALAIAREIGDRGGEGADLGNLGLAYAALGDARKAIEYYEQALVIAREIRDRRNEGAWLGNLGNAYGDLGDARKAIEYYEQALVIAREIGDRRNEGNSLGNLGNAYGDLGDVRKAIEYYEKRLAIAREIGDRRGEGNVFGNLGIAYNNLGDTRKAIVYYEQALAIAREIGDRRREGAGLGNLGSAYIDLGDTRKAIEYYEQALAIDREIGDKRGEGANLGNLGIAYKNLGDARKAIEYHEQALAIDREIGDKRGEGADLGNLGSVFYGLDDIDKSQDHYQQQLMIAREIGDRNGEANALWGQAICLKKKNDPEQAIEKAESALMIFEQIESPSVSTMRKLLAEWKK